MLQEADRSVDCSLLQITHRRRFPGSTFFCRSQDGLVGRISLDTLSWKIFGADGVRARDLSTFRGLLAFTVFLWHEGGSHLA
jgi:hypothetical protein